MDTVRIRFAYFVRGRKHEQTFIGTPEQWEEYQQRFKVVTILSECPAYDDSTSSFPAVQKNPYQFLPPPTLTPDS